VSQFPNLLNDQTIKKMDSTSLLLAIETSGGQGSVAIFRGEKLESEVVFGKSNQHHILLEKACGQALDMAGIGYSDLKAVAVSAGPGSYTGLRIGAAYAKGICFGHNLPLIAIDSIAVLAWPLREIAHQMGAMLCPMVDARRMEVYTALYGWDGSLIRGPKPVIPEGDFLADIREGNGASLLYFGSGAAKMQPVFEGITKLNYLPGYEQPRAEWVARLASLAYAANQFVSLSAWEPEYLKGFMGEAVSNL
jgi:tRNA threonylcarbamoyladenosine biosynthesis protein TsaB